jgi:hypothetical protein
MRGATKHEWNRLSEVVKGAAIAVYRELDPRLLEAAYQACLQLEWLDRRLKVERQNVQPVV